MSRFNTFFSHRRAVLLGVVIVAAGFGLVRVPTLSAVWDPGSCGGSKLLSASGSGAGTTGTVTFRNGPCEGWYSLSWDDGTYEEGAFAGGTTLTRSHTYVAGSNGTHNVVVGADLNGKTVNFNLQPAPQSGGGGPASNCADGIDNDGDGFKDNLDCSCGFNENYNPSANEYAGCGPWPSIVRMTITAPPALQWRLDCHAYLDWGAHNWAPGGSHVSCDEVRCPNDWQGYPTCASQSIDPRTVDPTCDQFSTPATPGWISNGTEVCWYNGLPYKSPIFGTGNWGTGSFPGWGRVWGDLVVIPPLPGGSGGQILRKYTLTSTNFPTARVTGGANPYYADIARFAGPPQSLANDNINWVFTAATDIKCDTGAGPSDGPCTVASGANVTLKWTTASMTACTAVAVPVRADWTGAKAVMNPSPGQVVGPILVNTNFTLNCTGPLGNVSDTVTVNVSGPPPIPTVDNVTISAPVVKADNATQYTISVISSFGGGGTNISHEYALINYQGENAGAYRGYLTWYFDGAYAGWNGMKDKHICTGDGGVAVIQSGVGYGDTYLRLDSCNVTTAGNTRTAKFVVRFDPSFLIPNDNDISGYACQSGICIPAWINFQTNFGLSDTIPPTGTIAAIPNPTDTRLTSGGQSGGTISGTATDNISVTGLSLVIREWNGVGVEGGCNLNNRDWNGAAGGGSWTTACTATMTPSFVPGPNIPWSFSGTPATTDMTAGRRYHVYLKVDDAAGNTSGWNPNVLILYTPSTPPTVTNVKTQEPDYCTVGPSDTVSWSYADAEGTTQSAYQIQIDNNKTFTSPELDSGKTPGATTSAYVTLNGITWGQTYFVRVQVWDGADTPSGWTTQTLCAGPPGGNPSGCAADQKSWTTPQHAYPAQAGTFTWTPDKPPAGTDAQFDAGSSVCYTMPPNTATACGQYNWDWGDGTPGVNQQNPTHAFATDGAYKVTLNLVDGNAYTCGASGQINAQKKLPWWKEILPH